MKYRITQTLMSSFEWAFKKEDGYEDFIRTLNREKSTMTKNMLDGIRYESCLNSVLNGEYIPEDHEWYKPITEMAKELEGSQQQVVLFRDCEIDGVSFLIHGVLDYLRAGHIWDCKFSKNYHLNKYLNVPQTSFYAYLVPEAIDMTYIISDGTWVYREKYPADIIQPIEPFIKNFMRFLEKHHLVETYSNNWRVNN